MAILTGSEIYKQIQAGNITMDPFDPKLINPNSCNLHIADEIKVYKSDRLIKLNGVDLIVLDSHKVNQTDTYKMTDDGFMLLPGILYLGRTVEKVGTTKFVPKLDGRSSTGRLGLKIHLTAGFGDIGFNGTWTLELEVTHPLIIYPGDEICQICFETVEGDTDYLYNGRYQGQINATASRFYENKKGVFNLEDIAQD